MLATAVSTTAESPALDLVIDYPDLSLLDRPVGRSSR
jgi:hypothetical protein